MEVPPVVRNKAVAVGASEWLDTLPALVRSIERDWEISTGNVFGDATEAFVTDALLTNGDRAVLKLAIPRDDTFQHEATVLRLAGGEGCARLLRSDEERRALLIERLGASLYSLGRPIGDRLEVLCGAAQRVWRAAPDAGLPTGADKAQWLAAFIVDKWQALDRPCSARAVDHALDCAARRRSAHDDARAVLVHGDVHQWNALQAGPEFKLIDPDGLFAEAEYDLGILMREDPLELMQGDPWERARWLARRCGLDATAIWEWGAVERVSTGLLCTEVDLQPVGRQMLRAAEEAAVAVE